MEVARIMAHHIRHLREASGISQRDLAIRLNVDEKNYGKLERGEKRRVDLEGLHAISEALEIGLGDILKPLVYNSQPDDRAPATPEPVPPYPFEQVIGQLLSIMRKQQFVISELDQLCRQLSAQE